jgi:molybdopterin synthase sulfur carrier subunit
MTDATLLAAAANQTASTGVRVRVVYLARLREAFGCAGETLTLPGRDALLVGDVLGHLRTRGGAFAQELAPGRAFRVAVNHAMASVEGPVRSGDELAILPPVTGG